MLFPLLLHIVRFRRWHLESFQMSEQLGYYNIGFAQMVPNDKEYMKRVMQLSLLLKYILPITDTSYSNSNHSRSKGCLPPYKTLPTTSSGIHPWTRRLSCAVSPIAHKPGEFGILLSNRSTRLRALVVCTEGLGCIHDGGFGRVALCDH